MNQEFQIIEAIEKAHIKSFINLPWKIYGSDPQWAPPLKMAIAEILSPKHPFYKTSSTKVFLAKNASGRTIGRIMGIVNHAHNEFHKEKIVFFGLFEVCPTYKKAKDVAHALLTQVVKFGEEKGAIELRGPVNPSTNYECGLLIEGHHQAPYLMMTYNPPIYQTWIESYGLKKTQDLLAYHIPAKHQLPEKIVKISQRAEKSSGLSYRELNKNDWDHEVELMFEIYNDAWELNWGFVPMSREEFVHTAKDLKLVVDPKLVLFALSEGKEVGFIVALPDLNQIFRKIPSGRLLPFGAFKLLFGRSKIDRVRVITMGLKQGYRKRGLEALLYQKVSKAIGKSTQYKDIEMSWVLEDNLMMNRPLELIGAKIHRRYRIFSSLIGESH